MGIVDSVSERKAGNPEADPCDRQVQGNPTPDALSGHWQHEPKFTCDGFLPPVPLNAKVVKWREKDQPGGFRGSLASPMLQVAQGCSEARLVLSCCYSWQNHWPEVVGGGFTFLENYFCRELAL